MGSYVNWIQVFGKKKYLWPFPFFTESGKPFGDGVVWPKKATPESDVKEVEMQDMDKQKNQNQDGFYNNN